MGHSILIVDDEPRIASALMVRLKCAGYEAFHAINGLAGVEAAELHEPDLVILDIRMPDIDGYEACKRIRRLPRLECVPIVFLSANAHESAKQLAFKSGGDEFVAKPFDSAVIVEIVGRLIQAKVGPTAEVSTAPKA